MTNYNERLDGIVWKTLRRHRKMLNGPVPSDILYSEKEPTDIIFEEAKQAITSLIKELVAEAKPDRQPPMKMGNPTKESSDLDKMIFAKKKGHNEAIDQFEQNLLKALEEV